MFSYWDICIRPALGCCLHLSTKLQAKAQPCSLRYFLSPLSRLAPSSPSLNDLCGSCLQYIAVQHDLLSEDFALQRSSLGRRDCLLFGDAAAFFGLHSIMSQMLSHRAKADLTGRCLWKRISLGSAVKVKDRLKSVWAGELEMSRRRKFGATSNFTIGSV